MKYLVPPIVIPILLVIGIAAYGLLRLHALPISSFARSDLKNERLRNHAEL
jgi:hypothetical protein